MLSWIATIIQLLGVWLNAKKYIACWPVWAVGATLWVIYGCMNEQWAVVALNSVFLVFDVYGWRAWLREAARPEQKERKQ